MKMSFKEDPFSRSREKVAEGRMREFR